MSETTTTRELKIVSLLSVATLGYSVRDATFGGGPGVLIVLAALASAGLLFVAWQPEGKALLWLRASIVRGWGGWLAALAAIGLVTSLASPWVLTSLSLRWVQTRANSLHLDIDALRQLGFPLLCLLIGAVAGPERLRRIADQSEERLGRALAAIKSPPAWPRLGMALGLAVPGGWLVWSFFRNHVYQIAPVNDSGFYLYIGWHTLRGGIPYQTVYYNHPPLQFVLSMGWVLAGQITGLGVINAARTYDLLVCLGLIALTYVMTRDFTKSRAAGWVAALALVGMEAQLPAMIIANSPSSKISVAFFNLLGVWLSMRRRWLAAGLALAIAASLWLPSAFLLAVPGLVVLLQKTDGKLKALGSLALAAGLVFGAQVGALALMGALDNAYRQVVASAFATVGNNSSETAVAMGGLAGRVSAFGTFLSTRWITDDLLLIGLIVCGAAIWLFSQWRQNTLRVPDRIAIPLACAIMLGLLFVDFQGPPDALMLSTLVCPFAGLAFASFEASLDRQGIGGASAFRKGVVSLALAWLLAASVSDLTPVMTGTNLPQLESRVSALASRLGPGDKVQTLSVTWFNVLAGVDNPTPYMSNGPKMLRDIITMQGKSLDDMVAEISTQDPVLLVVDSGNYRPKRQPVLSAWLDARYVRQAQINNGITQSLIFVRKDRTDIQKVVADLWNRGD